MTEEPSVGMSRRRFLKIGAFAGAGLTVGIYLGTGGERRKSQTEVWSDHKGHFKPNAWVCIGPDESVTVRVNHTEMGQGITTALAMIVAEELDADWANVRVDIAPAEALYKNPAFNCQMTAASTSVKTSWDPLRRAGAAARQMLMAAAARTWDVPIGECRTERGVVLHEESDRRLRYGELVEAAAKLAEPDQVILKEHGSFRIIGHPIPRLDTLEKVNGSAVFGIDVRVPGMLNATVVHAPVFGARAVAFDATAVGQMPGVHKVFEISSGIAVVADTFWQAKTAAENIRIQWAAEEREGLGSEALRTRWAGLCGTKGKSVFRQGDVEQAFEGAAKTIQAIYELPYQAHATPEPMNCTAHVEKDRCEIWAPTQNQDGAQETAARITGLGYDRIAVHTPFVGGGFGRRVSVDYVAEAVEISKAVRAPVKVTWTREEDMRNGFYRPAVLGLLEAALDADGQPIAWKHRIVGPDHMAHQLPHLIPTSLPYGIPRALRNTAGALASLILPRIVPGKKAVEGAAPLSYALANVAVEYVHDDPGIPLGFWRSVAFSQNVFFVESFMDEIAAAAGRDPLALRLSLLHPAPRLKDVLELAAEKANWGQPPRDNWYRGLAAYDFHGTHLAAVAEISVGQNGRIRVHRVVCAVNCGVVVNPKLVAAQITGGIAFGLTAALKSRITVTKGQVDQGNFDDFPLLRMHEMPEVEVHIVPSADSPTGIGESAVPIIAPAVANAFFAATGRRMRRLPLFA
jgi:CO/xanthine dehydrogenase Mo-binding subunit